MDKNDIRIGDTVLVTCRVRAIPDAGGNFYGDTQHSKSNVCFHARDISAVVKRAETDAEKIARLAARVAELEAEKLAELCKVPDPSQRRSAQQSEYDKQPRSAELTTALSKFEPLIKPRWDFCSGKKKKLWYPPQPRGFGPWIEGRVPDDVLRKGAFQLLYRDERREKTYTALTYSPSGFVVSKPENVVAYCLKED